MLRTLKLVRTTNLHPAKVFSYTRISYSTKQLAFFTKEEVSKHNTKDDCWLIIHGKVYDVSDYVDEHPGGDVILTVRDFLGFILLHLLIFT